MREVQLPCAPLPDWLPARLGERVRVVSRRRGTPWALSRFAARWPPLPEPIPADLRLDALVILDDLNHPPAPGVDLASLVGPGGLVAELVPVRTGLVGTLLGLDGALRAGRRAAGRALDWGMLGLYDLEQWASVDPPACVLTLGRLRVGAGEVREHPAEAPERAGPG